METLKKYWKEILVIFLLFSFIGYVYIQKTNKNEEQEKIKKAIEELNIAQKNYLEILEEKRANLEEQQKELEGLESVISAKIESTTQKVTTVKNEKTALKQKYKVGSVYNSNKLDSLLQLYSKSS